MSYGFCACVDVERGFESLDLGEVWSLFVDAGVECN